MTKLNIIFNVLKRISDITAREQNADISSPLIYKKEGVKFLYPSNWKVIEDDHEEDLRYITINSPGHALVSVQIYLQKKDTLSLFEYAKWFSDQARSELPIGKVKDVEFVENKRKLSDFFNRSVKETYIAELSSRSQPHVREHFKGEFNDKVVSVLCQVAEDHKALVQQGFDIILSTFSIK